MEELKQQTNNDNNQQNDSRVGEKTLSLNEQQKLISAILILENHLKTNTKKAKSLKTRK